MLLKGAESDIKGLSNESSTTFINAGYFHQTTGLELKNSVHKKVNFLSQALSNSF